MAFMTAKIEERGEIAAKLAAAAAYTPFILRVMLRMKIILVGFDKIKFLVQKLWFFIRSQMFQDFGADPGEACIKSQDYISR